MPIHIQMEVAEMIWLPVAWIESWKDNNGLSLDLFVSVSLCLCVVVAISERQICFS